MVQIIKTLMAPILNQYYNIFPKKGATILAYHQVVPRINKEGLLSPSEYISSELFEKHLLWLKKRYKIVPLSDLLYRYKMGFNIDGLLSITIDDGWENTYTEAFPLLKKHQVPATVFLTTDFIDTQQPIWFSALNRIIDECRNNQLVMAALIADKQMDALPPVAVERLKRHIINFDTINLISELKMINSCVVEKLIDGWSNICKHHENTFNDVDTWLSWDEITEMQSTGLIEFGPHGGRHYFFTTISDESIFKEITSSWNKIDEKIENKIKCFCYPGGLYSTKNFICLENANMESAITFSGGKLTRGIHRYQIPRNGVNWKSCCNAYKLYNLVECVPGYYKKYPVR